jgi:hypothetical protein
MSVKTRNLNLEELYQRGEELRNELNDMTDDEGHLDSDRLRSLNDEAVLLDSLISIHGWDEERDARKARIAATADMGGGDQRDDFSTMLFRDEGMKSWFEGGLAGIGSKDNGARAFDFPEGKTIDELLPMPNQRVTSINVWGTGGPPTGDPSGTGSLMPVGQPIPPTPRQARLFMRDLLPTMNTTLASVPYVRELNPVSLETTGGAGTVTEGATKPVSPLSFSPQNAQPTVIAATLVVSKQMFADGTAVMAYINQRLPYLIRLKEDQQFLSGTGTWPDLQGILNVPGLLTQTAVGTDTAQTVAMAIAQIENQDGAPNAVIFNPTNAWAMFSKRAPTNGTFDAGTPFSSIPLTVWGLPTYRSRVYPAGHCLVGDFQNGGMILDRQQVSTQVYQERYAEANQTLLICEERVGIMWFRPDLFCNTVTQ